MNLFEIIQNNFNINFFSFLPLFGIQIIIYKTWIKNKDFNSATFCFFGIVSFLFFCSKTILISFILWECLTWVSYFLLKTKNNANEIKVILINNIIGGLAFTWAICILLTKCIYWSDIGNECFNRIQIIHLSISLAITILSKSSQFPFSWLTLTQKSSSLVSAYLHSSTVVVFGIYLLFQLKSSPINNQLFKYILIGSCSLTSIISYFQSKTNNLKTLVAITSQVYISACIVVFLQNSYYINYVILIHAIYKPILFIICDYIKKTSQTYSINKIKEMPYSIIIVLFIISVPMCSIPGFYANTFYDKSNIIWTIVKSINFMILIKLFYRFKYIKITKFYMQHILFFPCIIFLLPYFISFQTIIYFFIVCLASLLIYIPLPKFNINIAESIYSALKYISISKNIKFIYIYLAILISNFGIQNLINKRYMIPVFEIDYMFLLIILMGCLLLLYQTKITIIAGLNLISICVSNLYMKHGGIDIVVTNILADIVLTYLIVKSKFEFEKSPIKKINLFISFLLTVFLYSGFKTSQGIIYAKNISVNDIVVFYRFLDTLGEIFVLLIIALCIKSLTKQDSTN